MPTIMRKKSPDRFKLEIDLGNDAMQSVHDVAQALARLAAKMRESGARNGTIRDENGNIVGAFSFEVSP